MPHWLLTRSSPLGYRRVSLSHHACLLYPHRSLMLQHHTFPIRCGQAEMFRVCPHAFTNKRSAPLKLMQLFQEALSHFYIHNSLLNQWGRELPLHCCLLGDAPNSLSFHFIIVLLDDSQGYAETWAIKDKKQHNDLLQIALNIIHWLMCSSSVAFNVSFNPFLCI